MPKHNLLGTQYLRRSKKQFLEGTRCQTPAEAVLAGEKTLAQWSDILTEERELELEGLNNRSLAQFGKSNSGFHLH